MIKTTVSHDSFDKKSVIQISYFNCIKESLYSKIIYLLLEKYYDDKRFNNVHVFLPTFLELRKFLSFESISYSDQFYLYSKKLRNIRHRMWDTTIKSIIIILLHYYCLIDSNMLEISCSNENSNSCCSKSRLSVDPKIFLDKVILISTSIWIVKYTKVKL